ncbi:MAG: acetyl-CoA carboxylase biotin carboxyl carrier protein subunit, partial [Myxococcales bacterium]
NVFVDGEYFQVDVDPTGGPAIPTQPAAVQPVAPPAAAREPAAKPAPLAAPARAGATANGAGSVVAPMPGMIIAYRVKAGDEVKAGDVLLILEAMKMENEISADRDGRIASLAHKDGDEVDKGELLLVVE